MDCLGVRRLPQTPDVSPSLTAVGIFPNDDGIPTGGARGKHYRSLGRCSVFLFEDLWNVTAIEDMKLFKKVKSVNRSLMSVKPALNFFVSFHCIFQVVRIRGIFCIIFYQKFKSIKICFFFF